MKKVVLGALVLLALVAVYVLVAGGDDMDEVNMVETSVEETTMDTDETMDMDMTAGVDAELMEADASLAVEATGEVKEFTLDSFNFGYSEEELVVNSGDTVTINLTSSDGFHDWVVDEFGAATEQINTGGTTSVTFVAGAPGSYEYYCSVGQHRANGMVGTLVVE